MAPPSDAAAGGRRLGASPARQRKRRLFLALSLLFAMLFTALGIWQVERRAWKRALIETMQQRIHAAPAEPPPPAAWGTFDPRREAYRHVTLTGRFLHERETLVQALTERGGGYWVVTPLVTEQGFTVLVNRGFVPPERAARESRRAGLVTGRVGVSGLLRTTEPNGRFLSPNRPADDRWYSRDVSAIVRKRGLGGVAPYFIDADAHANLGGLPVGGLTVVDLPNNHLVYALTWFALAALSLTGSVFILREGAAPDRAA